MLFRSGGIIPACVSYQNELAQLVNQKRSCGDYDISLEDYLLSNISKLSAGMLKALMTLEDTISNTREDRDILAQALYYQDCVLPAMLKLRRIVDELETLTARKHWPVPTYAELLNSVV